MMNNNSTVRLANVRFISGFDVKTRPLPRAKSRPTGVAISATGDYIVADNMDKLVKVFNKMGQLKLEFGSALLKQPWDVTILNNGNIAVTDPGCPDIKIFSPRGEYVKSFVCAPRLKQPFGIHTDHGGKVVVTSKGDNGVFICNNEGDLLQAIKPNGGNSHQKAALHCPLYVSTDKADNIVVTDAASHSVLSMARDGKVLFHVGLQNPEGLPHGIAVDSHGNILVADSKTEQIELLTHHGAFVQTLLTAKQGLENPLAVVLSNDGQLVLSEGTTGEIKSYDYLTI